MVFMVALPKHYVPLAGSLRLLESLSTSRLVTLGFLLY